MSNYEKFINVFFKVAGIIYLVDFIAYVFNCYQPPEYFTATNMLIISIICLFGNYSNPRKV